MLKGKIGRYPHTYRLLEAPVSVAGEELAFGRAVPGLTAREMIRDLVYDVTEMPLVNYLAAREQGVAISALPVFLSRRFPQPMLVTNIRTGPRTPADLEGGKVGLGYYGNSDTAWVQVMLAEQFGVDCGRITWVASQGPQVPRPVPPNVTQIGTVAATETTDALPSPLLGAMLAAGELSAVVYGVPTWDTANPDLAPLLHPADSYIDDWMSRTGTLPILHVLVIADRVIEAHPDLPGALFRQLEAAKRTALADPVAATGDPELATAAVRTGFPLPDFSNRHPCLGADPIPYGLSANLGGLRLLARHVARLGLLDATPDLHAVFLDVTADQSDSD